MFDILNKLGDVKKKMEEIKSRLNSIYIDDQSPDGKIKVTLTGNRKVKSVYIDPALVAEGNAEEIQEMLETVLNRALDKAEKISEDEMKSAGKDLLPGFPGL
ncbi:MAG: YbaB/EbfC family nucleoid-associated protein [Bacteroidota bacterium]